MTKDSDVLLSVVIPVYNEKDFLAEVVRQVRAAPYRKEIIIVDDASTDGTREVVDQLRSDDVRVFTRAQPGQGRGTADRVRADEGRYRHHPGRRPGVQPGGLSALLQPILDGRADAVFGSRFLGGPHRVMFFWHRVGNAMLTTLSNMMTNLDLSDMETGYKVFRGDLARSLRIRSNRFAVEPEMTAKLARMKARIYETPISYSGRDYAQGKKITWRDGFSALWHIFRFRFFD